MTRKEQREQAARNFESVEYNSPYTNFIQGAIWADRTMLDNVCKYLYRKLENGKKLSSQLIDNLRKEMEE